MITETLNKLQRFAYGKRIFVRIFIVMGLFTTAGLMYIFPVFQLPKPTGEFKVGTKAFHFVDKEREEFFDKSFKGNRQLMLQVWYPIDETKGKPSPFIQDKEILKLVARKNHLRCIRYRLRKTHIYA